MTDAGNSLRNEDDGQLRVKAGEVGGQFQRAMTSTPKVSVTPQRGRRKGERKILTTILLNEERSYKSATTLHTQKSESRFQ